MDFLVTIILLTMTLHGIHTKKLDPGPQVFNNTTKLLPQTSQKRYATKEIILYLTPSQIRALQDGQGFINPQHVPHDDNEQKSHALANAQADAQAHALELARVHALAKVQANTQARVLENAQAHDLANVQAHALANAEAKALADAQEHALADAQAKALANAQEHALANAQKHTLANAQEHALANAQAHALANAQAHALANAQAHALANAQAHALANAQAHNLANARAHALENSQAHDLANAQAHAAAHAAVQHAHEENFGHLPPPQPLKATPIEESHSDHFVPIIPPPEYRHSDNYAYINFHPTNNPHIPKPVPSIRDPHENSHKGLPPLIPHEQLHENLHEISHIRDHLKEQWYRLLDQNRAHLKALASSSHYQEKLNEHKKDVLQYAPNFSDQKYGSGIEQLIRHNHQLQLEKQHALLQAAAIANSPPVVVHKEINIKHSPVHLIKQVKVPVPTPVLIPIPEPFEVRVPQPYPVPLEIIKPVPVPIANADKIHFEKQVLLEQGKHFPFPITKPYLLDRVVPLDGPEHKLGGVLVHSHPWKQ